MTLTNFIEALIELNRYTALPGILFFLLFNKKIRENAGIIFLVLLVSFLGDYMSYIYIKYFFLNSYAIANIWYLANFPLILLLFWKLIGYSKSFILSIVLMFVVGSLISFKYYDWYDSNTFIRLFSNITFIILCISAFHRLLNNPGEKLSFQPVFWIVTAIFIHSCLTFLRNIFLQYLVFDLQATKQVVSWIWFINLMANITKNIILFYALVLIDKGYPDSLKSAKA